MNLLMDTTYKFTFIADFANLNGVYTVVQSLNYQEVIASNIDLFADLYEKAGKTNEEYEAGISAYTSNTFFKLVKATTAIETAVIIYVPADMLDVVDANVAKYSKMMLTIDLGAVKDLDQLVATVLAVGDVIAYRTGNTIAPRLVKYGDTWLTETEYDAIVTDRAAVKQTVVNSYSEAMRLSNECATKDARIAELEKILVAKINAS